jgi:hypothetical protein
MPTAVDHSIVFAVESGNRVLRGAGATRGISVAASSLCIVGVSELLDALPHQVGETDCSDSCCGRSHAETAYTENGSASTDGEYGSKVNIALVSLLRHR